MSSWTSLEHLEFRSADDFREPKAQLWEKYNGKFEVGFVDMDCGEGSIKTKKDCDRLIKFLQENRRLLK